MDFFAQQERARRQTRLLMVYFILSVAVVVALVYLVFASLISGYGESPAYPSGLLKVVVPVFDLFARMLMHPLAYLKWVWRPHLFLSIASWALLSICLGSFYKIKRLSKGGSAVAELLGGRPVKSNPDEPDERRLRHVVEEMAIASGMPVPEIYLLENERGINTFAAGHTHSDIAIGLTRGCLKLLTRDELQGAIAHEFSHILNGDTRLNMRLMGVMHGILWPVIIGRVLIRGTNRPADPGESILDEEASAVTVARLPLLPFGAALIGIGSIGLPFVRWIKSALCREREWLADAEAVQFTRHPAGIVGALKKAGGLSKRGRLDTPRAETASHLYFVNSSVEPLFHIQSTHPPLEKRILAIDSTFDGRFPHVGMLPPTQFECERLYEEAVAQALAFEKAHPDGIVSTITVESIRAANAIRLGLPESVSRAIREPVGAMAVTYAMLLGADEATRNAQIEILRTNADPGVCRTTLELLSGVDNLDEHLKLPVIDMALPALRNLGPELHQQFAHNVQELIEADHAIDLFEYTLQKILFRHLRPYYQRVKPPAAACANLKPLLTECAILLSALAYLDRGGDPVQARAAFRNGARLLEWPADELPLLSREACNLPQIDVALDRLAGATLVLKRKILLACAHTVAADNRVARREAELLRAIADMFGCPIPPFVEAIGIVKESQRCRQG